MATETLTARGVASLKPDRTRRYEVFDADCPSLALRVSPAGRKTWVLFYRKGRVLRRYSLGVYPDTSLAKARKKARDSRYDVEHGGDPASGKKAAREAATVKDLAADYIMLHAKPRKRSWEEDQRILDIDVLPTWGHRAARDITRRDVRDLVATIAERGAGVMANRTLAVVSTMFNFALDRETIEANPATRIKKPGVEARRTRVLTDDELRQLWAALEAAKVAPFTSRLPASDDDAERLSPTIARGLQVLMLAAQRPGECFGMRWQDVDLTTRWWTLPGSLTKNKRAHRVYLSDPVLAIVKEQQARRLPDAKYVFAGLANSSVALRAKKASAILSRQLGFVFWRHDLRRTAITKMAAAGVARDTLAAVVNHADGGPRAMQSYDHYARDKERKAALNLWARVFQRLLDAKPVDNVIAFPA
ncbi:MAG: integrase arm-type DNA-binding domain-containing protein [Acidobacteriota bacterium]